jgi:hypothetical protein
VPSTTGRTRVFTKTDHIEKVLKVNIATGKVPIVQLRVGKT